ncbi:MAG: DUF4338 domain-containing protein [Methylicorpusculum sp.]|uniref:Druantia anti-phage system protein DruA n=1 Tax=Methylicorpusculum sp. TaxID=2713644 RepID=UPI002718AC59|nr:Druantia anti-phage system protein DruA [Methylicorpusculum sp.]MDO8846098.1 DUF4338 domain-containing protein [Methylicorpusculum sp.]MDO8940576.1 DUF4338 domain-containing protein [Methylicorpusculum sp.]MDP2203763.1 DUF4338 domain-containing protein [Methylicorpusculum sp.]
MKINLEHLSVRPVTKTEEPRYRELMQQHHYLGDLAKIGHTLWYVATYGGEWTALLSFSAAAWKCSARDRWIGWRYRHQYSRLNFIANNSRFLILPDWHYPNLGSKVLSLSQRRISTDWQTHFGKSLLLLETFVDPSRFHGTVYRAANWQCVGQTQGYRRTNDGYSANEQAPKLVFVRPLQADAQALLANPLLDSRYQPQSPNMMLTAEHMTSLPDFFKDISDPRRGQGRIHALPTVLAIATAAVLCGMRGYKAIAGWANDLSPKARERFRCRRQKGGGYRVPSEYVIRDLLIRVDPVQLDAALQQWNALFGQEDQSLAIDGKTMCNAIDEQGQQTHIMSVVGHESAQCYTQKKSAPSR